MRYVNIIQLDTGIVQSVHTYTEHDVKSAENKFTNVAKSIDGDLTDEDISDCLDNGYYTDDIGGKGVYITWSEN